MKTLHLREDNPLVIYQRELSKENAGKRMNNWKIISDRTKLHLQTIMSITRLDLAGVKRMSLGTYLVIKDTLGVDLLSFGKDNE